MRNPSLVKQEFLRKWIKGLKTCRSFNTNMTFLQRKQAIKLSADLAMASTRSRATRWSRALIARAASPDDGYNKLLADHILGTRAMNTTAVGYCSRRIVKRCRRARRVKKKMMVRSRKKVKANSVAKRLVEKRRRMLKSVVPGGESMDDDVSLIEETLDYIQSLRAQVEVMRCIVTASASHLTS